MGTYLFNYIFVSSLLSSHRSIIVAGYNGFALTRRDFFEGKSEVCASCVLPCRDWNGYKGISLIIALSAQYISESGAPHEVCLKQPRRHK